MKSGCVTGESCRDNDANQDPESGEGMDNIEPLFGDLGSMGDSSSFGHSLGGVSANRYSRRCNYVITTEGCLTLGPRTSFRSVKGQCRKCNYKTTLPLVVRRSQGMKCQLYITIKIAWYFFRPYLFRCTL